MDVTDRMPKLASRAAYIKQHMRDKRIAHKQYIVAHGEDMPEVRDCQMAVGAAAAHLARDFDDNDACRA